MEPPLSVCETALAWALVVIGVGDVQRQLDILFLVIDDVCRVAGALGVGGGIGLDGLGHVLGLVRREGRRRFPITSDVALVGGHVVIVLLLYGMETLRQEMRESVRLGRSKRRPRARSR